VEKVLAIAEPIATSACTASPLRTLPGMADPVQVAGANAADAPGISGWPLALHFHNTRGMGLANVLAAMSAAPSASKALSRTWRVSVRSGGNRKTCVRKMCAHALCMRYQDWDQFDSLIALARDLPVLLVTTCRDRY